MSEVRQQEATGNQATGKVIEAITCPSFNSTPALLIPLAHPRNGVAAL